MTGTALSSCCLSGIFAEDITNTTNCVNQARLAGRFELLTQITNIHLDDIAFAAEVVAPYAIVDHLTREHLLRMAHKQLEQLILLGREINSANANMGLVRRCIHSQWAI